MYDRSWGDREAWPRALLSANHMALILQVTFQEPGNSEGLASLLARKPLIHILLLAEPGTEVAQKRSYSKRTGELRMRKLGFP